jgi:signal recognition particle receptor subunit beta
MQHFFSARKGSAIVQKKTPKNMDPWNVASAAVTATPYDETVLLCGPRGGGKTRLFYHLCLGESNIPTVTSVQANMGIPPPPQQQQQRTIRYIDWPGHASTHILYDDVLRPVLEQEGPIRFVVVVDSTQPVGLAADTLHQVLQFYFNQQQQGSAASGARTSTWWKSRGNNQSDTVPTVLIACHKQDAPKAKNPRRIQLQLRTELERLLQSQHAATKTDTTTNNTVMKEDAPTTLWWPSGVPLDWDALDAWCRVRWVPTHCNSDAGIAALRTFCTTGQVVTEATPTAKESSTASS